MSKNKYILGAVTGLAILGSAFLYYGRNAQYKDTNEIKKNQDQIQQNNFVETLEHRCVTGYNIKLTFKNSEPNQTNQKNSLEKVGETGSRAKINLLINEKMDPKTYSPDEILFIKDYRLSLKDSLFGRISQEDVKGIGKLFDKDPNELNDKEIVGAWRFFQYLEKTSKPAK